MSSSTAISTASNNSTAGSRVVAALDRTQGPSSAGRGCISRQDAASWRENNTALVASSEKRTACRVLAFATPSKTHATCCLRASTPRPIRVQAVLFSLAVYRMRTCISRHTEHIFRCMCGTSCTGSGRRLRPVACFVRSFVMNCCSSLLTHEMSDEASNRHVPASTEALSLESIDDTQ